MWPFWALSSCRCDSGLFWSPNLPKGEVPVLSTRLMEDLGQTGSGVCSGWHYLRTIGSRALIHLTSVDEGHEALIACSYLELCLPTV